MNSEMEDGRRACGGGVPPLAPGLGRNRWGVLAHEGEKGRQHHITRPAIVVRRVVWTGSYCSGEPVVAELEGPDVPWRC